VLLRLECERVNINSSSRWNVLVVLVRLNKREVITLTLSKAIVTVKLKLSVG
jgi:hypothetical protein